jgi:hypothetical protein
LRGKGVSSHKPIDHRDRTAPSIGRAAGRSASLQGPVHTSSRGYVGLALAADERSVISDAR